MDNLAYMTYPDWAQKGAGTDAQSQVVREWAGPAPHLIAVTATTKLTVQERRADLELLERIAPDRSSRLVFNISTIASLVAEAGPIAKAVIVLNPYKERDLDVLYEAISAGQLERVFVLMWPGTGGVQTWLDAHGAFNLGTGEEAPTPDPLLLEAASMLVDEGYNGLSSGNGKDAVVQLLRAFHANGYPLDTTAWLRAFYAEGGSRHGAEAIETLMTEMKKGTRHRVNDFFVDNVFDLIRQRAGQPDAASA